MSKIPIDIYPLSLNVLAMRNELKRIACCICRKIDSHVSPTSSLIFCSTSFEQPPRTSMMILYWLTLYSGYQFASSSLSRLWLRCLLEIFRLSIFQPWTAHFNHSVLLLLLLLLLLYENTRFLFFLTCFLFNIRDGLVMT